MQEVQLGIGRSNTPWLLAENDLTGAVVIGNYTAIINLETGQELWKEMIMSGRQKSTGKIMVATQSQWGWIPSRKKRAAGNPDWKLSRGSLLAMLDRHHWVGGGGESIGLGGVRAQVKAFTLSSIDTDVRGSTPNINLTRRFNTPFVTLGTQPMGLVLTKSSASKILLQDSGSRIIAHR